MKELRQQYFNWLFHLVCGETYLEYVHYQKLLRYLFNVDFTFTLPMDENRVADGIALRHRFGHEQNIQTSVIDRYLGNGPPCSVLEMMVALSVRCEEHVMSDDNEGDRTGQWFWSMVVSLGLGSMTDAKFNQQATREIVDRFLDRRYGANGRGGLFTLQNCPDLRNVEIWYQAMWYLDDILNNRGKT